MIGQCPRCGGQVVEGKKGFGCLNYKQGCKFTIWKKSKSSLFKDITISASMAKRLLAGEKIETTKLYSSKTDNHFSGAFKLKDEGADYGASFELILEDRTPLGKCPRCGGDVIETGISFRCENYTSGCKFTIWKKPKSPMFKDITITTEIAKKLLANEKIKTDNLYSKNKYTHFSGYYMMDDSAKSEFGASLKYLQDDRYNNRSGGRTYSSRKNTSRSQPKGRF